MLLAYVKKIFLQFLNIFLWFFVVIVNIYYKNMKINNININKKIQYYKTFLFLFYNFI